MATVPLLHLSNLSKTFGETKAVDGVDLTVHAGEIYGLVGPNGAGKTTIIKMIASLLIPTSGAVEVCGFDIVREPRRAKSSLGYIPDDPVMSGYLTGRELLRFTGLLQGLSRRQTEERIAKLLPLFHLESLVDGFFAEYSRGNKQKVVILSALVHQPKILVIDEPIVGLDPESVMTMQKILTDHRKKGGAVFLVTHTLEFAQRVCTKFGILKAGKLVAEGSLPELRKQHVYPPHS